MAAQYSLRVRNARLDAVAATIGPSAVLKIFAGPKPASCAAVDPYGLLCEMALPAEWMNAAADGAKTLAGLWTGNATGDGVASSWRIYDANQSACDMQGDTVSDMVLDNRNIAIGQPVTVRSFALRAVNP